MACITIKYVVGLLLLYASLSVLAESKKAGFLFTMPQMLRQGRQSRFCLTVYEDKNVTMSLINRDDSRIHEQIKAVYDAGAQKCNDFTAPPAGTYELLLYNDEDILHDSVEVTVVQDGLVTLVQTDKSIYKAGQKVRFRILTIQADLKPRIGKIASVYISDPNESRVKQFLNVDSQGIASLEFQLSAEPKLGKWKVSVFLNETDADEAGSVYFSVKEYVLPRFEVIIKPPKYMLASDETVEGQVCADYTYGKPVKGFVDLKVCLSYYWGNSVQPCFHETVEFSGCHNFSAKTTELKGTGYYSLYGRKLQIKASVTEAGTGVVVNGSNSETTLTHYPLKISMEDYTNGFFKPGLPYYGKIIVTKPDGTPAPGQTIKVTASDYSNDLKFSQTFVSDKAGVIVYALCGAFIENSTSISIDAQAKEFEDEVKKRHDIYTPQNSKTIQQWFSPSLSYVEIPKTEGVHKCGHRLTLSIPFTTREKTNINFFYQVIAKGKILKSGQLLYQHNTTYPGINLVFPPKTICLAPVEKTTTLEANFIMEEEPVTEKTVDKTEIPPPPVDNFYIPELPEPYKEPIVRSDIVSDKVSNILLDLPITTTMAPKFSLLVYHTLADGEVVADSMEFNVKPCFDNDVKFDFNKKSALPREEVKAKVGASPGSVCGIGVVDKSVNILGGKNQITAEKVYDALKKFVTSSFNNPYRYGRFSIDPYCEKKLGHLKAGDENSEFNYWQYNSPFVDASEAFQSSGLLVLTDLDLETRPCQRDLPVYHAQRFLVDAAQDNQGPSLNSPMLGRDNSLTPTDVQSVSNSQSVTKPRENFPETWLWDLVVVGDKGSEELPLVAPDTITSWVGNAMCVDGEKGFGISNMQSLTTFKPFFIYIQLPYSAVRGERLPVLIKIFNYLDKCLHIKLTVDAASGFKLHDMKDNLKPMCICSDKSYTDKFYVTPTDIGDLPLIAKAEVIPGFCTNRPSTDTTYIGMSDIVKRNMLVKPEGVMKQYTRTMYMCPKDNGDTVEEVVLPIPDDIVKDSARGDVKVIGDLMGPALTNLDKLVRMPTGCGEQNMVGFTPNIFVLKYLTSTGRLTEKISIDAKRFMEIGYQRELKYRHDDGSFSAFGKEDARGSVWLTAFVVDSFAQARPYIYIDEKDMDLSIHFLKHSQLENGCFRETGKVLSSYMMGGLGNKKRQSYAALTAYVLVSLLNAGVNSSHPIIADGFKCLNQELKPRNPKIDVYSLTLLAYANTLREPFSRQSVSAMKLLEEKAKKDGTLMYWTRGGPKPPATNSWYYNPAPSAEVEMTAYALLTYTNYYGNKSVSNAHGIAMWLSQQRNPYGGFSSTQDTVVGLNGLAEFASYAYSSDPVNVKVSIKGTDLSKEFMVSEKAHTVLLLQKTPIPILPDKVTIKASGTGCALVQANVRFNKAFRSANSGRPSFFLKVATQRYQHDINKCNKRSIHILVGNRAPNKYSQGMILLSVKMITSWTPIPDSLTQLRSKFPELGIKRYEYDEKEGIITFYFEELRRRPKRLVLDVEYDRDMSVSHAKPAEVKVMQYYETDVAVVSSYHLKKICGTKNEIPFTYVPVPADPDFPVQTRMDLGRGPPPPPNNLDKGQNTSTNATDDCPLCFEGKTAPSNLKEVFCNSLTVLKAISGRKGRFPLKLRQDVRMGKPILKGKNKFADYKLPDGCDCSNLKAPAKKIYLLTNTKLENKLLALDGNSIILLAHKKMDREMRRLRRQCRPKPGRA